MCTSRGYRVTFENDLVKITRGEKTFAVEKEQLNEIFRMFFESAPSNKANVIDLQIWHKRAGHVNKKTHLHMVKNNLVEGADVEGEPSLACETCHLEKAHRLPFVKKCKSHPRKSGEYFHSDICGLVSTESLEGSKYFLLFKDDTLGYRHIYCVKHKSYTCEKFKEFEILVFNKFNHSMKILRYDNGGQFCNEDI